MDHGYGGLVVPKHRGPEEGPLASGGGERMGKEGVPFTELPLPPVSPWVTGSCRRACCELTSHHHHRD